MGVAAYSTPTQAPCDDCPHFASCRATGTICAAFVSFVSAESRNAWRGRPRVPNAKLTAHIWKIEANESAEAEEKLRRRAKRRYQRAWRKLNPEAMRRARRRWLEGHRAQHRAAKLRWYHLHHEQARAANRAWAKQNPERRLELQRRWHDLNRDRVNAQQRARYAKNRERLLAADRRRRAEKRQASAMSIAESASAATA